MVRLRQILTFGIIVTSVLILPELYGKSGLTRADTVSGKSKEQIVRVYFPDRHTANKIFLSFEGMILETNYEKKYHIMSVTPDEMDLLTDAGLEFEIDTRWTPPERLIPQEMTVSGITSYPCYETVEETYAKAQAIADKNPNLASWIDVGDSWEKTAGLGGYDMMVLVLTNRAISGNKPKFFATAAIHAREYTGAPLCLHFAKYLVDNYGIDADVTWILDYHEIHLMFHTNPDGRKQAEAGLSWRKNTNQNYCGATSSNRGADLNRNYEFQWGCCSESSGNECDEEYRGPYPVSEPEIQAVEAYMRSIFPDQRGPGSNDAAPDNATGVFIDFHSYSELVIWPWGYTTSPAPNGVQMRTLGRKFAYWNGYTPDQGAGMVEVYTEGTSKDFCYGVLGVPSYTFELGTAYFQSCSYYENNIVPGNLPAMIYAAKVARTPYVTPAGPNTYSLAVNADNVTSGTIVTLKATVDDTRFNNSNGTEPTQNIAAAEYYVDTPPWIKSPIPAANSMSPADGVFNSKVETVEAQVDTTGWSSGKHILFVRGRDINGDWGAFSAVFLNTTNPGSEQAATPISSPTPETYDCGQGIEITCSSPDAKIYYTINGDDPTELSTPYEQPIYFNETTTLKARAYKNGWNPSDIATWTYVTIDTDGDGTGDCEEQGPAGNDPTYDGNNDGIADSLQDNVASFHTYDRKSYVTLASQPGTSFDNYRAADNPSSTNAPSDVEFSYGFFEFTIVGAGSGSTKTVTLHFPAGATFDTYYKYGPTPSNSTNHWYEFLYDGQTGAEISGNVVTLHFIDGARGDDDLTANGNISDIGGPGSNIKPGGGQVVGSSGSGGGGCFIATAAYGSLMEPHVKILREFRDRFLLKSSIGKAFVNFYYKYSPPLASFIEKHHRLRMIVRLTLFPLVCISWVTLRLGFSPVILSMLLLGLGMTGLFRAGRR